MPDAKVVHINDGRPARGTRAVLAGADRASGERERRRRRTTPLLSGAAADGRPPEHAGPEGDARPDSDAPRGDVQDGAGRDDARGEVPPARAAVTAPAVRPAERTAQRSTAAKRSAAKRSAAKRTTAKRTTAKRTTAKRTTARKATARKTVADSATPATAAAQAEAAQSAGTGPTPRTAAAQTEAARSVAPDPVPEPAPARKAAARKTAAAAVKKTATKTAATKTAATKTTKKAAPARTAAEPAPAKATATKAAADKAAAKQAAAEKAAAKQAAAEKAAAKQAAAEKAAAKQAAAEKAAAKQAAAERAAAKQAAAERAAAKQAAAERAAAKQVTAVVTPRPAETPAPGAPSTGHRSEGHPAAATQNGGRARIAPARNPNRPPRLPRTTGSGDPVVPLRRPAASAPLPSGGRQSLALAIAKQAGEALLDVVTSRVRPVDLEEKLGGALGFLGRRLTGEYELDDFGFDPEFTEAIPLALLKPLYDHWFRVEVRGIENIPAEGGALIVANHSGGIPVDSVMTAVAIHTEHPQHRFLRALGADLVFQLPFIAGLARRSGVTLATNPDAERLLSDGHVVGVWPEGFKGVGKPFSERYKLQRFGRGGFVSAALRTGTPIIPCSIVGAEEIYPIISDLPSLARLLGLPYVPITPFFPWLGPLGAIPLPSKWLIEFGPPVPTNEFGPKAAEDPMLVFDLTDQVRQSIQQTLYSLLVQRRSIFF